MGWGDEIMATGDAIAARKINPKRVQIVGWDGYPRWHELWEGNPDIARPAEIGQFQQLVNGPGKRPYHKAKGATRWTFNLNYRATPGRIVLTEAEQAVAARWAGRLIVEPHIKARAPVNKQWGWVKWNKLAWLLQEAGHKVTQIGPAGTAQLEGVEFITTGSFREACAVISRARAVVLPEGGLHHAAAAFGVPGVVIFGGFTPVELTGYAVHTNLGASLGEACGMRVPCEHCAKWMDSITPHQVVAALEERLERHQAMARPVAA